VKKILSISSEVTEKDFADLIDRIPLLPNIEALNP